MKRILQIALIALLTIVFVGLFLWKSNLTDVWRILKATDVRWLIAGLLVNFSALIFRTIRWRILIAYRTPPPFYATFFANTIGYALSAILPIRAGDVARPALLSRRTNVRFSDALGTVLAERVLDLVSILVLLLFFCVRRWREFDDAVVHGSALFASLILLALAALMIIVYFFRVGMRNFNARITMLLPRRFREPAMRFLESFSKTLELVETPAASVAVLASTAAIWICLIAQYSCALFASHRRLPIDASFFLNAATTVGVAIPTPGGVGGFHKICQWVLTSYYGFDIDRSVAVAVLLHVVSTAPVLIAGAALFLREGLSWRELSRETTTRET